MSLPRCGTCAHLRTARTCDAFPQGIPMPVLVGDLPHTTPLPGDHGIQYEAQEHADDHD